MHQIVAFSILVLSMGFGAGQDSPLPKGSLRQLRFSPNGRYVLAQDDSEITILNVQPLSILFRIPADRAEVARFTPDSRQVVFVSSATHVDFERIRFAHSPYHVERWGVGEQYRLESTPLPLLICGTEELSQDGRVLACVDLNATLLLVDVATGRTIFEKKKIARLFANYNGNDLPTSYSGELGSAKIDFSPDSRFVVVRPVGAEGPALALNVREPSLVPLTGELKQLKEHWMGWIAPDRVLIAHGQPNKTERKRKVHHATVVGFPSGTVLSETVVPYGRCFGAADSGFIITLLVEEPIRIIHNLAELAMVSDSAHAAATELSTGLVIISDTPALDVLGRFYVAEPANGEVGLYEIGKGLKSVVVVHPKVTTML